MLVTNLHVEEGTDLVIRQSRIVGMNTKDAAWRRAVRWRIEPSYEVDIRVHHVAIWTKRLALSRIEQVRALTRLHC